MACGYRDLVFETDRLLIRAWRLEDTELAFKIYSDPRVARYMTGIPEESIETQTESLSKIINSYSKMDLGLGGFPLIEKETQDLIGAVLLKPLPRTDELHLWREFRDNPDAVPPIHEIEVGWHLRPDKWGKGFATEAGARMLEYGFQSLGLNEIYAILFRENVASANVTKRLNLDFIESTERFYGKVADLYSISKEKYLS